MSEVLSELVVIGAFFGMMFVFCRWLIVQVRQEAKKVEQGVDRAINHLVGDAEAAANRVVEKAVPALTESAERIFGSFATMAKDPEVQKAITGIAIASAAVATIVNRPKKEIV